MTYNVFSGTLNLTQPSYSRETSTDLVTLIDWFCVKGTKTKTCCTLSYCCCYYQNIYNSILNFDSFLKTVFAVHLTQPVRTTAQARWTADATAAVEQSSCCSTETRCTLSRDN